MVTGSRRSDPSALRFLIGHDLRATRERSEWKQSEAGTELGCSQAKINYLESGKTQQQPEQVRQLLRAYGAEVEHIDRMSSLAGRADQDTWWAPFGDVLPNWFKTFVGLEGLATAASTYASLVLPGQVQTAAYANALLVGNLRVPPMDTQQVVRARMNRQRLLETEPLRFRAVIEEYALDRMVGGPQVMCEQLKHLLTLAAQDTVELHVMPLDVPVHDGLDGDFLLLDFDEAQSIGYIEYPAGALYVQEPDQIETYNLAAERLCDTALSQTASADAIAARVEKLEARMEE